MTPDVFQQSLDALGRTLPPGDDPRIVDVLEALADGAPADLALRNALRAAHARFSCDHGLRPIVAGVAREHLVRWTLDDATWTGTVVKTGEPGMVRCLRASLQSDPLLRRQLVRDVRALRPVVPQVRFDDADAAISTPLPGPAFQEGPPGGDASVAALARLVGGTVHHLARWHDAGLGIDDLDPSELRDNGEHLVVVTLTPRAPHEHPAHWAHISRLIDAWWDGEHEHPIAHLIQGWLAFPPHSVHDAAAACQSAMAEALAAERHALVRGAAFLRTSKRRDQLDQLVGRLSVAVPPPSGHAALGVDLDGRSMVVTSDGSAIAWGPTNEAPVTVYDEEDGFDVPAARRLVRARGTAMISKRDNEAVGGDPAFADAVSRWLGASLELRTIQLLLDATADTPSPSAC